MNISFGTTTPAQRRQYEADRHELGEQIRYALKIEAQAEAVFKIASARLVCIAADLAKHTDADVSDFAETFAALFQNAMDDTFSYARQELENGE